MHLHDLRCDGTRLTGPKAGIPCNYLLFRMALDLSGRLETKCPRCNRVRMWSFANQFVGVST